MYNNKLYLDHIIAYPFQKLQSNKIIMEAIAKYFVCNNHSDS
ncbi:hypothetical protein [Acetivibrio clariflavus]|nr:hypothetical protein [Acetivibrio clariflavus]